MVLRALSISLGVLRIPVPDLVAVNPKEAPLTLELWEALALRFSKGAIHGAVLLPVIMHSLFACMIAYIDQSLDFNLGLPSSIVSRLPDFDGIATR